MHANKADEGGAEEERRLPGAPQTAAKLCGDRASMPALPSRHASPCENCALRAPRYFCSVLFEGDGPHTASASSTPPVTRSHQIAPRRRNIYRGNDSASSIAVICDGWACTYVSLPSGKRQILGFLLPGEITSAAAVFQDQSAVSVEAVTDLRYCMIDKSELKSVLSGNPRIFDAFSKRWAEHEEVIGKLATDLGHKTAEQRIALLILGLMERHRVRNLVHDDQFDFPLRQRHIADATGLTVVHVNRVVGNLRRLGIIEIKGRTMTVHNLLELEHIVQ